MINTGRYGPKRSFPLSCVLLMCWLTSLVPIDVLLCNTQVPEEEKNLGPNDRVIHVYHFTKDTAQNQMVVATKCLATMFFFSPPDMWCLP